MLANLFRKTKIISLSLGAFLIFLLFVFYHSSFENLSQQPLLILWDSALKTSFLTLILLFLMIQENQYRHINIFNIHSLSTVLILFYLPSGSITLTGLLIQFFLALALHFTSKIFLTKNTLKSLFNLTLILCGLAVFEPLFLWFFLGPLLFFLDERLRNTKHLLVIFIAILCTVLWVKTTEHYFQLDPFFKGSYSINFVDIKKLLPDELALIVLVALIVLIPIKNTSKRDVTSNPAVQAFLITWLFLGIYSFFLGGTAYLNPWELTLFPLLYLLGIFLNKSSDRKGTLLVFLLLAVKVLILRFLV
tara:strand:+ start:3681 stop:4595 length:915 start_codon:yes stop_codon:yes gene_type:complete